MSKRVHYQEVGGWPWWVHTLIWFCALCCIVPALGPVLGWGDEGSSGVSIYLLALGFAFPGLFYFLMGSLRIRVTAEAVILSWGMAGIVKKVIQHQEITGMEAVTYRPLVEFGGWGIRMGGGKKLAWTVSGNQALTLSLRSGTQLYVGSRHPSRLAERIRSGMSIRKEKDTT